jgi:hypothetical protein
MTQYLFALYGAEDWYDMSADEWAADMKLHDEFTKAVEAAGAQIVGGAALQHSRTAAVSDNRGADPVVTDGPFIETKEALGGFYLVDVRDRAQALELAALCPVGRVEVRPVLDMSAPPTGQVPD